MKTCPNCGMENNEKNKFCLECGEDLTKSKNCVNSYLSVSIK